MSHLVVNWLAVILATVAGMALGFGWYMALSKPWMAAAGLTRADVENAGPSPFIIGAACQLVMAYFVALLTPILMGEITILNAVSTGAHMWLGFVATSMIINHRYQMKPWSLTMIDGGYLLGVLLIQGVVIGVFG